MEVSTKISCFVFLGMAVVTDFCGRLQALGAGSGWKCLGHVQSQWVVSLEWCPTTFLGSA